jgi:DNA repair exonuclease SbcCD ATPase subunit
MRWKLRRLHIQNFLSYKKAMLTIPRREPLILRGENGSGKSVWFEAILFCFYGKVARKIPIDEVINATIGRNAKVKAELESPNGSRLVVQRFRKSGTKGNRVQVWIDDQEQTRPTPTQTQKHLEEVIGVDYETFVRTSMLSLEFLKTFATSTTAERKAILTKMIGIRDFDRYVKFTNERIAAQETKAARINSEILVRRDEVTALQHRIKSVKRDMQKFEKDRTEAIEHVVSAIEKIKDEVTEIEAQIEEKTSTQAVDFQREQEIHLERLERHERELEAIQSKVNGLEVEKGRAEERLQITQDEVAELKTLSGRHNCPYCRQKIKVGQLRAFIRDREGYAKSLADIVADFNRKLRKAHAEVNSAEKSIRKEEKELRRIVRKLEAQEHRLEVLDKLTSRRDELLSRLARNREEVVTLEKQKAPLASARDELKDQLRKQRASLTSAKSEKKKVTITWRYLRTIRHMFKTGLRDMLFARARNFLGRETNKNVQRLFESEVSVDYEGFDFHMQTEGGAKSFGGSSQGEKRRLVLSQLVAFQALVRSQRRGSIGLLFFDEPFDILDRAGCERAADLIRRLGEDNTIMVATHRDEFAAFFDKVISVRKRADGFSALGA